MKVTIGQLLGIGQKAAALKWSDLAKSLSTAANNPLVTKAVSNSLITAFQTAVQAFAIYQTVNDILITLKPFINLAAEIGGAIKDPAMWGKIAAEAVALLKKLLMDAGLYAIGQVESYILGIEIDLGDLTPNHLNTMNKNITNAANSSAKVISATIKGYNPSIIKSSSPSTNVSTASVIDGIYTSITSGVQNATDLTTLNSSLSPLSQDPSSSINRSIYGQDTIPNTGALSTPLNVSSGEPDIASLEQQFLNQTVAQNVPTIQNTDNMYELLDNINAGIQGDLNNLFNQIDIAVAGITVPVDTTGLNSKDASTLTTMTNSFLSSTLASQAQAAKNALNSLFSYNDIDLRNILALVVGDYNDKLRLAMLNCLTNIQNMINSYPIGTNISVIKASVLAYLANCKLNTPSIDDAILSTLFNYLNSIYPNLYISNTVRYQELLNDILNVFGGIQSQFIIDIIEKIKLIRLVNQTILDNYYIYSYSSMISSLTTFVNNTINSAVISSENDFNNLKTNLLNGILNILISYPISVSENIPHGSEETIEDKLSLLRIDLNNTVNTIINTTPMLYFDYSLFTINLDDTDKTIVRVAYEDLKKQFITNLLNKSKNIIYNSTDGFAKLTVSDYEYNLFNAYTSSADNILKKELYIQCENILTYYIYANYLILGSSYLTNMRNDLDNIITNYNYTLDYAKNFASRLKELEISLIQNLVNGLS